MKLDWWRDGLRLDFRIRPMGIALSALYAITCLAVRDVSLDQFHLPAGIRIAALLLVPPRLWIYLALGEYAYLAWVRYPLVEEFGLAWATVGSAILIPLVAVAVRLHMPSMKSQQVYWLLSLAACSAVLIAVIRLSTMHLLWPEPPEERFLASIGRHVLGDYIGILTVAPLALLWVKRHEQPMLDRTLLWPSVSSVLVLVALGAAPTYFTIGSVAIKTAIQLMMLAPVIALTCMHGWRGAAIGVPLINLAVHLTTPSTGLPGSFDAATFKTQQIIAATGTALLALGSRITQLYYHHVHGRLDRSEAMSLTRSAQMASEMNLRARALDIRGLSDNLDRALSDHADWLRNHGHDKLANSLLKTTVLHSRKFREQVTMVYPTSLEHVGLYLALQIGGISEAWSTTNRLLEHRLTGDPCQLSVGLQLAAYRTLTEAVALLLQNEPGQIQIRARSGTLKKQKGIMVSISVQNSSQTLSATTLTQAVERLAGRTIGYGGSVECRHNRIRMLLLEERAG